MFVLDGDKRDTDVSAKIKDQAQTDVPVLFLPGRSAPEAWLWSSIRDRLGEVSKELGVGADELAERLQRLDAIYDSASDSPSEIAKNKLYELADSLNQSTPHICRLVARLEARSAQSEIQPLVEAIDDALIAWRQEYETT